MIIYQCDQNAKNDHGHSDQSAKNDHGHSDQSAKNYHGHGVHSDNRHHDYANESITLFGQTNRRKKHVKWVNFRQLVVQTEKMANIIH